MPLADPEGWLWVWYNPQDKSHRPPVLLQPFSEHTTWVYEWERDCNSVRLAKHVRLGILEKKARFRAIARGAAVMLSKYRRQVKVEVMLWFARNNYADFWRSSVEERFKMRAEFIFGSPDRWRGLSLPRKC